MSTNMESNNTLKRLKPINKVKAYESVVEQITSLIDEGGLNSGDKLPPERELAETLNVSRHTVREALRTLENKQLVKSVPGSGTFVTIYSQHGLAKIITEKAFKETGNLVDIFELRKMVEPQIAYLAAVNATTEERQQLITLLDRQQSLSKSGEKATVELQRIDAEFHHLIARMSKNKIVLIVLEQIDDLLAWSRNDQYQGFKRINQSLKDHERIATAITKGNSSKAKELMLSHIEATQEIVFKRLLSQHGDTR